jgi:hypothetical protein
VQKVSLREVISIALACKCNLCWVQSERRRQPRIDRRCQLAWRCSAFRALRTYVHTPRQASQKSE